MIYNRLQLLVETWLVLVKDDFTTEGRFWGGDWSVLPTACSDRTCRLVLVKDDWLQQKAGFGEVIGRFTYCL